MPVLDWIGKQAVVNHHKEVPYRLLHCKEALSAGDPDSGNLLVQGDNLEALKALLPYYRGQVQCIYIDPPYNTGNEGWIYNDNVTSPEIKAWLGKVVGREAEDLSRHDKWLCMMYPRLKLLKKFLKSDGMIFIQIDDNEYPFLKSLCDEIFGYQNYETTFFVKVRHEDRILRGDIKYQLVMEQVLIYRMSEQTNPPRREKTRDDKSDYIFNIELNGSPESIEMIGGYEVEVYKPGAYSIFETGDGLFKQYQIRGSLITQQGSASEYYEKFLRSLRQRDGLGALYKVKEMGRRGDGLGYRYIMQPHKSRSQNGFYFQGRPLNEKRNRGVPFANFYDFVDEFNRTGNEGGVQFRNGKKPKSWIEFLLSLTENSDGIILDSFAGSGTTGHAVLDLNKQDGRNRKFILVEVESKIATDVTAERLRLAIQGYNKNGDPEKPVEGLGGGFRYCYLGTPLFDDLGDINPDVTFLDLAAHVFFSETGSPLPAKVDGTTPFIGQHRDKQIYLLFSATNQGFSRETAGNVLTPEILRKLPPVPNSFDGKRVVYAEGCTVSTARLKAERLVFKQIPYQIEGSSGYASD